ncbi:heat shock protein [Sinobacterium caligoides]|uniref:Protease HtpX n=1 Tax=Sinobacterium caligoides TaxID=933926 RepID=A0A3N2DMY5_9GAMM|nr:protease HtpX [Sinobacterium caligoides]ROS01173.1 heat shock protein [Sinobacterium caligoides]
MKRIALFLATNLAIMLVLGIVLSVFGVDSRSTSGLLIMALLFGMGGSFISLLLSKKIALSSTGATVIKQPRNEAEAWLVDTVARQAQQAGIGMPDVAIYQSPEVNAFATGAKRNEALVAVSSGLLQNMGRDEVEAVLGHEVSHVANGDMVTLTLIQGVVNTFVIFLARMIAGVISNFVASNNDDGEGLGMFAYMAVVFVLEMCLGVLASIIVAWFSRQREFKADTGGAVLAGRGKMIAALRALQHAQPSQLKGELTAFGINGGKSMAEMMMSHPPLEKRIAALEAAA